MPAPPPLLPLFGFEKFFGKSEGEEKR